MTKARIYTLDHRHAKAVLIGRARILNLPGDAEVVAYQTSLKAGGLDLRIHSRAFAEIPEGHPLPVVPAQVEVQAE